MRNFIATLIVLVSWATYASGQLDKNLPLIEDFENQQEWPWNPWNVLSNGTSTQSKNAAHSGNFGLVAGNYIARTDIQLGTSGQTLSFWIRFMGPSRAHCGFGFQHDSSSGFFVCLDPSTNTLHISRSPDYTFPILKSVKQTYRLYAWYWVEIKFHSKSKITANLYKSDGHTLLNSITHEIPNFKPGGISLRGDGKNLVFVDDIRGGTPTSSFSSEKSIEIKKGEKIVLKNILFQTNESILLPSSFPELDKLVYHLKNNPFKYIEISGNTDSTGNERQNIKLSMERAGAVARYLINKGVNENKISSKGLGSSNPISSNKTEEGRKNNRRVEFIIQ